MTKLFVFNIVLTLLVTLFSSGILLTKDPAKVYITSRAGGVEEIQPIARD